MTGNQKRIKLTSILSSVKTSPFHLELKKSSRGAVVVVSGVMGISEFSEESVTLLSHSGRLILCGNSLGVSVLENRIVEVYGQITEVKLTYGKA